MRLAGVEVSDSTAARLAARLHRNGQVGLALDIGLAIDHMRPDVPLTVRDRQAILFALDDPTDELAELRGVLLNELQWRQEQELGRTG